MKRNFSIIELLFVLAVIAVLGAITVPILAKVRDAANGINCISQLRALGMGFALYCAENQNFLPHHDNGSDAPPSGYIWYQKVLPYLGNDDAEEGSKYRQEAGFDHQVEDLSRTVFSYKMNSRLEDYKGTKGFASAAFRNISSVSYPSRTVLIFDGRMDKAPYNFQPYGSPSSVHARHGDKAGILFIDWTAKLVEGEQDENHYWKHGNNLVWDPDSDH